MVLLYLIPQEILDSEKKAIPLSSGVKSSLQHDSRDIISELVVSSAMAEFLQSSTQKMAF